jgi:hypothetical protein
MAAHLVYPPVGGEAIVRGDPVTFVMRVQVAGVDQDISTWTWRSHVRRRPDSPTLISECASFEFYTPDDFPDLYPDGGATTAVLLVNWTGDQTADWRDGFVADVEQLTPTKRTWVIMDRLRVDKDVSFTVALP